MSEDMRRILAQVLYFEREKVGPPDTQFDVQVAQFLDRLDSRAVGNGETS